MRVAIADTESNGFVDEATTVWCISAIEQGQAPELSNCKLFTPDKIEQGLAYLHSVDVIVFHGGKKHDLPLLKKLYGWEPKSHQSIVDTLIYSRMLYPKRPLPAGYTGNKTHSIEAWGYRVGRAKPDHDDWSQYTPAMGIRCCEDAIIGMLTLEELEIEAGNLSNYYEQLRSPASIIA